MTNSTWATTSTPAAVAGRGTSEFTELARLVHAERLLRRRYGYYWAKLIGLPALVLATIAVFVWIGDTWWQLITAVGFGLLFAQVAYLGHDAAHRQIFVSGPRTRALCVIPWGANNVAAWDAAAAPERLGEGKPAPSVPTLDPVVVEGLRQLTRMVNHANNLAGSLDHRDAVAVLRELHRGGYSLPADGVYSWVLANGWPARGAERLREMATKIDAGRIVQLKGSSPLRSDVLDRWRAAAAGAEDGKP